MPSSAEADKHGSIVIGFDVEWRPTGARSRRTQDVPEGETAPVAVVQLSSEFATVVVNVFALGRSLKPQSTLREACTAGATVLQPIFENQELLKVGLSCHEDLKRLRLTLPQCEFPNTKDLKVRDFSFSRMGIALIIMSVAVRTRVCTSAFFGRRKPSCADACVAVLHHA